MITKDIIQQAIDAPFSDETLASHIISSLEDQLEQKMKMFLSSEDYRQDFQKNQSNRYLATVYLGNDRTLLICKAHFEPRGFEVELDYAAGTYLK